MLPVAVLCGPMAIQLISGCSTEEKVGCPPGNVCTPLNNDGGKILDGTGGGGGGNGTGGSAGVPKATALGKACVQDSDCKSGLTCVTSSANDFGIGGPAG